MLDLPKLPVFISIHDVMPTTLTRVGHIAELLDSARLGPATLLVVPGAGWNRNDLATLRQLERRGYALAGHGWVHRVEAYHGLYHRLHGRLLSRNVAEHLALNTNGIEALITKSYSWFTDHDLGNPELYVPPAWAMGGLSRQRLRILPYRFYESFSGIYDSTEDQFHRLPLLGYEADTWWRAFSVRSWNSLNRTWARWKSPVRLAIHPGDLELRLANDLKRQLHRSLQPLPLATPALESNRLTRLGREGAFATPSSEEAVDRCSDPPFRS